MNALDKASEQSEFTSPATEPGGPSTCPEAKRYILILFQGGGRRDPLGILDRNVAQIVQDELDEVIESSPKDTVIDLWLESPGGDAHAAYKMFLDLRYRASQLAVVIPDFAKSAATLLALGCDAILMAPAAELGPLDMQMEHPDREGTQISALDATRALTYLARFAADYVVQQGAYVRQETKLPRLDVLTQFSAFVAAFLAPMVSKLDPQLVHHAANDLDVATRYAVAMLARRKLAHASDDDHEIDLEQLQSLAEHFVSHYPAHEFVICRGEAAASGLPVFPAEEYNSWQEVRQIWKVYRQGGFPRSFAGEQTMTLIKAIPASGLAEFMEQFVNDTT